MQSQRFCMTLCIHFSSSKGGTARTSKQGVLKVPPAGWTRATDFHTPPVPACQLRASPCRVRSRIVFVRPQAARIRHVLRAGSSGCATMPTPHLKLALAGLVLALCGGSASQQARPRTLRRILCSPWVLAAAAAPTHLHACRSNRPPRLHLFSGGPSSRVLGSGQVRQV